MLYYLLLLKLYNNVLMLTRLLLPAIFLKFTRRKPIIPLFKSLTATILKESIFSHIVFHLSMKDLWKKLKANVTLWNSKNNLCMLLVFEGIIIFYLELLGNWQCMYVHVMAIIIFSNETTAAFNMLCLQSFTAI